MSDTTNQKEEKIQQEEKTEQEETQKIKEARYLIIIPIIITVICLWLDIFTSYVAGEYEKKIITTTVKAVLNEINTNEEIILIDIVKETNLIYSIESMLRCAIGYLFPSILSIVIALIWQQISLKDKSLNLEKSKTLNVILATIAYCVVYLSCLINYNIITAIIFCVATLIYILWFYKHGIDTKLKSKPKNDMNDVELYERYVVNNSK